MTNDNPKIPEGAAAKGGKRTQRAVDAACVAVPIPAQAPALEAVAEIAGTRFWYWDTGGPGQPVIFLHPASGSALTWVYQQPVFAGEGYRVIAYSRRGHFGSDAIVDDAGTGAGDLEALVRYLNIERFHLISTAAGTAHAMDYALLYPERLLSLTLTNGLIAYADNEYERLASSLTPPEFLNLPPEIRELGPTYRATNPKGVADWLEQERKAVTGKRRQPRSIPINWASVASVQMPVLLMTGGADLYMPPPLMHRFAQHFPNNEYVVVQSAGHAIHWEYPDVFNTTVLDFLRRNTG